MSLTITDRAEFGTAMPQLSRRAFSGLALAALANPHAFGAAADPFNYAGADRNAFLQPAPSAKRSSPFILRSSPISG
jgi:hypothetical protein